MIRDKNDWSLDFNNIDELKVWLNYDLFKDCDTLDEINNKLLKIEDGIITHWFEEY
jgi:hypothetical protein